MLDIGIGDKKLDLLFGHEQGSHSNKIKQVLVESHCRLKTMYYILFILCVFVNAHKHHSESQWTT